jgi:dimeric dUTPase (all-alpha-NTP-PPase superfamily)
MTDVREANELPGRRQAGRRKTFAPTRAFALAALPPTPTMRAMDADKLDAIFQLQKELNQRIGVDLDSLDEAGKTEWVLNYTRAMQQELAELIDSVPWKWWAKYQTFDEQNARVEVVDLFHFLVSLAQTLGMSADDIYAAYLAKNKVNHARQDSGYQAKDADDSRHI